MNAIEMLLKQHRRMESSLKSLVEATGKRRVTLFADTADALMVHVLFEEEVFYPAVKARRTEDILLDSLEEHLSIKRVLADLLDMPIDDARVEPKLHVLREQAEHHHEEEEEKLFPKVKKLLTDEELNALGDRMQAFQVTLKAGRPRDRARQQTAEAAELK